MDLFPPTEEEWRELEASHAWREIVLPYLSYLERQTLDQLQEAAGSDPEVLCNIAGRLQALAAIRDAPKRWLTKPRQVQEPAENEDGRRRDIFERFRRGLRRVDPTSS